MKAHDLKQWLSALDLAQVCITATIDVSGRLGSVGGLWPKLLAAAEDAATLSRLRFVIVADEQPDVPPELLAADVPTVRVIRAATLQEVVEKLYQLDPRLAVRDYELRQCARLEILEKAVPFEQHYQVLPVLKEVKRERLRRDPTSPDNKEAPESLHRLVDILRWEEEQRTETVSYERLSWEQLFSNFQEVVRDAKSAVPRLVALGPPGSGKTTLLQYLVGQVAQDKLRFSERPLIPTRVRLRDFERWVDKSTTSAVDLPEYLAMCYKNVRPAPTVEHWRTWLLRGEVLLLLDGLDEVSGRPTSTFAEALKTVLTTFKDCSTVLTCRTISFERYRALCPDFPLFTLAGLDQTQRDAYIRVFPAKHPDHFEHGALIDQLNRTPQLRSLSANPLLLAIICYVVDDPQGVHLPATRGQLYDKAIEQLLSPMRPRRVAFTYPSGKADLPLIRKRRILERAALRLFAGMEQQRQLTFGESMLVDALTEGAKLEGLRSPADVADKLLMDLTHNSGLLRGDPNRGYFFLHLTVQEYLAACALARLVNDLDNEGWETHLKLGSRLWTVRELVKKMATDPLWPHETILWQETILLLAGQLQDPTPLLELLDPILAALCLPEISCNISNAKSKMIDQISLGVFNTWHQCLYFHGYDYELEVKVPWKVQEAVSVLEKLKGRIDGEPIQECMDNVRHRILHYGRGLPTTG